MANYREKIAFLRDYIANKDDYLPLIDHAWKCFILWDTSDQNICHFYRIDLNIQQINKDLMKQSRRSKKTDYNEIFRKIKE